MTRTDSGSRRAICLMAAFGLLWALVEAIAPAANVPATQVVFVRYGVHLLFVLLVFGPRYGRRLCQTARPGIQIGRSLLMLAMPLSFLGAVARMPATDVMAIFWTAPLLLLLAAGRQVVPRSQQLIGIGAFAGVLLILHPSSRVSATAAVFSLLMAGTFVLYEHLTRLLVRDLEVTNLFHTAFWVFLILLVPALREWRMPTLGGWFALIAVGTLGCLALLFLDAAIRITAPAVTATVLFIQPVVSLGLNVMFHMTRPGRGGLIGAALVTMSVVFTWVAPLAPPEIL